MWNRLIVCLIVPCSGNFSDSLFYQIVLQLLYSAYGCNKTLVRFKFLAPRRWSHLMQTFWTVNWPPFTGVNPVATQAELQEAAVLQIQLAELQQESGWKVQFLGTQQLLDKLIQKTPRYLLKWYTCRLVVLLNGCFHEGFSRVRGIKKGCWQQLYATCTISAESPGGAACCKRVDLASKRPCNTGLGKLSLRSLLFGGIMPDKLF